MIQSMTGFGEVTAYGLHCEIKTLNHRFFETSLSIPPILHPYEFKIRKILKHYIKRGIVFLKLLIENPQIEPDIERAKRYCDFVNKLKKELNIEGNIPIEVLLEFKKERLPEWEKVEEVIVLALNKVIESREEEGKEIEKDIKFHLKRMENLIKKIKNEIPTQRQREKEFKEKVELFVNDELNRQKLREELALFFIRENFNEEIVRINTHLNKFKKVLQSEAPSGRYLIFLIQEIQREMNTISAKAKDAKISQTAVEFREELEILREQVENIR